MQCKFNGLKGRMTYRLDQRRTIAGFALSVVGCLALFLILGASRGGAAPPEQGGRAMIGEARRGGVTVPIAPGVGDVGVTKAKVPGRPIVVIDPGHGGRAPGAVSVSGEVSEKLL